MKTIKLRRAIGGQQFPDYRAIEANYWPIADRRDADRAEYRAAVRLAKFSAERLKWARQFFADIPHEYARKAVAEYEAAHNRDVYHQHKCAADLRQSERRFVDAKRAFMRRKFFGVRTAPDRRRRPARGAANRAAIAEPLDGIDYKSSANHIAIIFAAAAFMRGRWLDIVDRNYMFEIEQSYLA